MVKYAALGWLGAPDSVAAANKREKSVANCRKQTGRDYSVGDRSVGCTGQAPQVGAGPDELVPFRKHDPRPGVVEAEPVFDSGGDFDRETGEIRRTVRDRQHQNARRAAFIGAKSGDNRARTIFLAFVAPFEKFSIPEVTVPDDQAWNGNWKRHRIHLSSASRCANSSGTLAFRTASIHSSGSSVVRPT